MHWDCLGGQRCRGGTKSHTLGNANPARTQNAKKLLVPQISHQNDIAFAIPPNKAHMTPTDQACNMTCRNMLMTSVLSCSHASSHDTDITPPPDIQNRAGKQANKPHTNCLLHRRKQHGCYCSANSDSQDRDASGLDACCWTTCRHQNILRRALSGST